MTLHDRLARMVEALPDGASVSLPVAVVRGWLDTPSDPPLLKLRPEADASAASPLPTPSPEKNSGAGGQKLPAPDSWRERLWTCPADMRMGVREVAEALDRSPDYVYRAVNADRAAEKGRNPLPCSRLDGELVFTAGAVRAWLQASEQIINPAPRRLRAS